jgi:hypothetical protein
MNNSKELAKKHFELMLKMGTEEHEITRCLHESKKRLILAKAKADNLPKKAEQERQFVMGLNPKAHDVIREWFRLNASFDEGNDIAGALEKLESTIVPMEDGDNGETAKSLWRQVLKAYVSVDCPSSVIMFVRGSEESAQKTGVKLKSERKLKNVEPRETARSKETHSKSEVKVDPIAQARPTQVAQPPHPKTFDADKSNAKIPKTPIESFQKLESITQEVVDKTSLSQKRGLITRRALSHIPATVRPHECQFLGTVKRILDTGQIFVHVECLLYEDELIELSLDQAKKFFPTVGDVTAFRSTLRDTYREGEAGIWTAVLGNTDKGTHYVISDHVTRVFDVISLPHASNEPDMVRQWLQDIYRSRIDIAPVFLLTDGLTLRLPGDTNDPTKHNFDSPIEGYWNLKATRMSSGRVIVVNPLPASDTKYDCAPRETLIKRLIKNKATSDAFPPFTKAQIHALVDFASATQNDSTSLSVLRAKERLLDVEVTRELLDEFILDLLGLPAVQEGIEAQKKKVIDAFESEMSNLTQEIGDLRRQREVANRELEKQKQLAHAEIDRSKKRIQQQEAELGKKIRAVFERASQEGFEVLAQGALFKAILSGDSKKETSLVQMHPNVPVLQSEFVESRRLPIQLKEENGLAIKNSRELLKAIQRTSSARGLSESMLASVVASSIACPVVGLVGNRVKWVVNALSSIISDGVTCEVSVSGDMFGIGDLLRSPALIRAGDNAWSSSLGNFLEHQQGSGNASVIELRGINRVPPESLLPELADFRVSTPTAAVGWIDESQHSRVTQVTAPVIFVCTFVQGRSTFPIEGCLLEAVPIVQVDEGWADQQAVDTTIEIQSSRATSEVWLALNTPATLGVGSKGEVPTVTQLFSRTAIALGFSAAQSEALAFLVLQSGRVPSSEFQDRIKRDCPEFLPYAMAVTSGTTQRILSHILRNEERISE